MITIRPASPTDIPALTDLCVQLGYQNNETEIASRLEALTALDDHLLLVAVTGSGKVVGWAHGAIRKLLIVPPHVELGGLVVDEAYRGQRIGEELLARIESWAARRGIHTIFVRSNAVREAAHRFYERLGYVKVKTSLTFIKEIGVGLLVG